MAAIKTNFGEGGANLTPTTSAGEPSLAEALRDIADDLVGVATATITSPDASDLATVITLVNEIKGKLNAVAGYAIKTTKG